MILVVIGIVALIVGALGEMQDLSHSGNAYQHGGSTSTVQQYSTAQSTAGTMATTAPGTTVTGGGGGTIQSTSVTSTQATTVPQTTHWG